jgi:hypothetical protein
MTDNDTLMRLMQQMVALSARDLSVLEAALKTPDSRMMTADGSTNYRLWSEMEKIGWMVCDPMEEFNKITAEHKVPKKSFGFTITEEGHAEISRLLASVHATRNAANKLTIIRNPSIGFICLDSVDNESMAQDAQIIGPLFKKHSIGPNYPVPCHVLFLYGKVENNGSIRTPSGDKHIRDLAKIFQSSLVVLASENISDVALKGYPWKERNDWQANIVFVNNRNGARFAEFFRDIFMLMFEGNSFGLAYVTKAPQVPRPSPDLPGSLLVMDITVNFENVEGGKPWDDYMAYASFTFYKDIGAKRITTDLLLRAIMALDEDSKHPETLFSRLGAFCGHSAQLALHNVLRGGLVKIGPEDKNAVVVFTTKNNDKYVYGEFINQPILQSPISVAGIITYALQATEGSAMNFDPLIRNVNATLESNGYGTITSIMPPENHSREIPIDTLKKFGIRSVLPLLKDQEPMHIGWLFALAAQKLILDKETNLSPEIAAKIFFESAFLASKLPPIAVEAKSVEAAIAE